MDSIRTFTKILAGKVRLLGYQLVLRLLTRATVVAIGFRLNRLGGTLLMFSLQVVAKRDGLRKK
jgi:hypothetical protein